MPAKSPSSAASTASARNGDRVNDLAEWPHSLSAISNALPRGSAVDAMAPWRRSFAMDNWTWSVEINWPPGKLQIDDVTFRSFAAERQPVPPPQRRVKSRRALG